MKQKNFINYGITSRSIQKRYQGQREMPYNYEIVQETQGKACDIYYLEKYLKKYIKEGFKYIPNIFFQGSLTECYLL